MSDAESLMWRLEKDPHLSSIFGNVTILDGPPDFDRLRRRMHRAAEAVPRLRQRVQPAPGNLSPPTWVDDPDFDLDIHLRHVSLPKPASTRSLLDYASLLVADPFDRTRPLWQMWVVEGLRGGKAALITKMHHTLTDGERGVELSLQYLDFERDAPDPPPVDPDAAARDAVHPEPPSNADALRAIISGGMRLPLGVAQQVSELLADPARIPDASAAAAKTLNSIWSQLSETDAARSPLWTERSTRRRIETARIPFADTKAAAKRLGGTLNTAFLAIATEAASRYHVEMGAPTETLRASMVVSTRTESSGGNAFSLVRMLVPTSEMPIEERFRAISERVDAARERSGGAGLDAIATAIAALPTSLVTRIARQQAQTIDFATSNVKGSPYPMYLAGAEMLENYPIGPLGGVAFNVTLLSYSGSLDMGINIDQAAVAEPKLLRTSIQKAAKDFVAS